MKRLVIWSLVNVAWGMAAMGAVTITQVMPDKLLYETGQPVNVEVTLHNPDATPVTGTLAIRLEWEMDEGVALGTVDLTIPAGETLTRVFTWPSTEVLGAGAYATWSENGVVVDAAEEFFNVVDADDALRVSQHATDQSSVAPEKSNTFDRSNYCNVMEIWAWGGSPSTWALPERYFVHGYRWVDKANLRRLCNNPLGKRVLAYSIAYALRPQGENLYVQHPDWFMTDAKGFGHHTIGMGSVDRSLRQPREWQTYVYLGGSGFTGQPDYLDPEVRDWWYDSIEASVRDIGWHGIRWDGHMQYFHYNAKEHYTVDGVLRTVAEKAAFNETFTVPYLKKRTRQISPTFLNYFNCEPALQDELPQGFTNMVSGGCVAGSEVTRHATDVSNPYHRWRGMYDIFSEATRRCRAYGGFYSAIYTPPWVVKNPDNTRIGYAMMNAIGVQAWSAGISEASKRFGDHRGRIVPYLKASTRYSALSWGHGMTTVEDPQSWISVTAPEGREVWWDRSVRRRRSVGGKDLLIIGIVNPPPSEGNLGEKQELPEPIEGIPIRISPPSGRVARMWSICAFPDTECRELMISNEGKGAEVVLPRLECSILVVAELTDKKGD